MPKEPIKEFQTGVEKFRTHINEVVRGTNDHETRVTSLEDRFKRYTPMIMTFCDSGDIAAFEIQGFRISDQFEPGAGEGA